MLARTLLILLMVMPCLLVLPNVMAVQVSITLGVSHNPGTPRMVVDAKIIISNGPTKIRVMLYFADGPLAGGVPYLFPSSGVPLDGTGTYNYYMGFHPEGPATSYRVVVLDDHNGSVIGEATLTNVPYTVLNTSTRENSHGAYVLVPLSYAPSVSSFRIRLPQENSAIIRDAILEWYAKTADYKNKYGSLSLYDMFPVTFTTAGVDSTGNENVEIVYSSACIASGSGGMTAEDAQGWQTKGWLCVADMYRTNPNPWLNYPLFDLMRHEFGHVLGLGDFYLANDNTYSIDVMNHMGCITTLDAYAIAYKYQAAKQGLMAFGAIWLPNNVPYECLLSASPPPDSSSTVFVQNLNGQDIEVPNGGSVSAVSPVLVKVKTTRTDVVAIRVVVGSTQYAMSRSGSGSDWTYSASIPISSGSQTLHFEYQTGSGSWGALATITVESQSTSLIRNPLVIGIAIACLIVVGFIVYRRRFD